MPADPRAAGRKGGLIGGKSKSAAKLAAARRNGFQRVENLPSPEPVATAQPTPANTTDKRPIFASLILPKN